MSESVVRDSGSVGARAGRLWVCSCAIPRSADPRIAMLDIRRRTGVLLLVATVAQLILISAQVQSKSGVPVFQEVTFGVFARIQGGTWGALRSVRDVWSNYVWLRGARSENETLKRQVGELQIQLQQKEALAARSTKLEELLSLQDEYVPSDGGGGGHRRQPQSRYADNNDRPGIR